MKSKILLLFVLFLSACSTSPSQQYPKISETVQVDKVLVLKSQNKMHLLKRGRIVKSYDISLGGNPIGHKVQEGDLRTPEGRYYLIYKNNKSKFYRSITVSYPNERDIERAEQRGVSPGSGIVIHGFPNELGDVTGPFEPLNWTEGCIAVRNAEMDEFFEIIALNTPIEIRP